MSYIVNLLWGSICFVFGKRTEIGLCFMVFVLSAYLTTMLINREPLVREVAVKEIVFETKEYGQCQEDSTTTPYTWAFLYCIGDTHSPIPNPSLEDRVVKLTAHVLEETLFNPYSRNLLASLVHDIGMLDELVARSRRLDRENLELPDGEDWMCRRNKRELHAEMLEVVLEERKKRENIAQTLEKLNSAVIANQHGLMSDDPEMWEERKEPPSDVFSTADSK